jgi:phage terminase large subunit GpA-like protein
VTLVKAVRIEFTTLLSGAIGSFVANEPSPILIVLPTESDCRAYMVSDLEFAASPILVDTLSGDSERNTLLSKCLAGGSLKIIAAKAPRNLRRHIARILIIDEAGVDPMMILRSAKESVRCSASFNGLPSAPTSMPSRWMKTQATCCAATALLKAGEERQERPHCSRSPTLSTTKAWQQRVAAAGIRATCGTSSPEPSVDALCRLETGRLKPGGTGGGVRADFQNR